MICNHQQLRSIAIRVGTEAYRKRGTMYWLMPKAPVEA